ncbi:MAG: hypothetical protein J0M34_01030 [Alphaproteobacteria bacterium]|nr:hypothetical protein [Alphaproteobacteria bacterium]
MEVEWRKPFIADPRPEAQDEVVWVDVSKIDCAWREAEENYIHPYNWGAQPSPKYDKFGMWFVTRTEAVKMPEICLRSDNTPNRVGIPKLAISLFDIDYPLFFLTLTNHW